MFCSWFCFCLSGLPEVWPGSWNFSKEAFVDYLYVSSFKREYYWVLDGSDSVWIFYVRIATEFRISAHPYRQDGMRRDIASGVIPSCQALWNRLYGQCLMCNVQLRWTSWVRWTRQRDSDITSLFLPAVGRVSSMMLQNCITNLMKHLRYRRDCWI